MKFVRRMKLLKNLGGFNPRKLLHLSFVLMVLAMPLHRSVWQTIGLPIPLQPAEVFALLFIGMVAIFRKFRVRLDRFTILAVLWLLINILASVMNGLSSDMQVELVKIGYVFILFLAIRSYAEEHGERSMITMFVVSIILTCGIALGAWLLNVWGYPNHLVRSIPHYPFIGTQYRALGFTSTSNMLGSMVMMALFLQLYLRVTEERRTTQLWQNGAIVFLLCAFGFAFAKVGVMAIAGIGVFVFFAYNTMRQWYRYLLLGVVVVLSVFYMLVSHIGISIDTEFKEAQAYGSISDTTYQIGSITIGERNNLTLKKGALHVFGQHPMWGIGSGQFAHSQEQLKQEKVFYQNLRVADPHCTFCGAMAELDFLGGALLLIGVIVLWQTFHTMLKTHPKEMFPSILLGLLFAVTMESTLADIMNFRHYAFLLAIMGSYWYTQQHYNTSQSALNLPQNPLQYLQFILIQYLNHQGRRSL
jgi:hypothetical protein